MTLSEAVLRRLAVNERTIKYLRADNRRVRQSRDEWKQKHAARSRENTALRRKVVRLQDRLNPPKRPCPPNVFLSERDLQRILEIPPR